LQFFANALEVITSFFFIKQIYKLIAIANILIL
jgi:hypothetical protein